MALWRRAILRAIRSQLPGTVLDIGCHFGETLADVAAVASPGDKYFGMDANPVCVRITKYRTYLYPKLSAQVVHAAAWNETSVGKLWQRRWRVADPSGSLRRKLRPTRRFLYSRDVDLTPVDAYAAALSSQITAAKIDVEGAELEVLEGIGALMQRDRFPVIIEILDRDRDASAIDHEERWRRILGLLSEREYTLHAIVKRGEKSTIAETQVSNPRRCVWSWARRDRQDYVALPCGFSIG